jgi:hypothetical protein
LLRCDRDFDSERWLHRIQVPWNAARALWPPSPEASLNTGLRAGRCWEGNEKFFGGVRPFGAWGSR